MRFLPAAYDGAMFRHDITSINGNMRTDCISQGYRVNITSHHSTFMKNISDDFTQARHPIIMAATRAHADGGLYWANITSRDILLKLSEENLQAYHT